MGHVVFLGEDHAARNGGTYELVAADGDAVDAGVESVGLGVRGKWQYHAAEGGVSMDVGMLYVQVGEDFPDVVEVVYGPLHGGADVGDDYWRGIGVDAEGFPEVVVVHLAVVQASDHDVLHAQETEELDDAVVGVLGEVYGAAGEEFPGP